MEQSLSRLEQRAQAPRLFRPLVRDDGRVPAPAGRTDGSIHIDRVAFEELIESTLAHLSPRRALSVGLYTPTWATFSQAMNLALRLDRRLFPEFEAQKVEAPVFIFANPRSGTTLLHRLMSFDDEHFVSMRLFETIFPAAWTQKAFARLADIDEAHLGGRLRRLADWVDGHTFQNRWEDVHKMGLREPEEDECLFVYNLQTPTTMLLVPFVDEVKSHLWFDQLPADVRGRFMDFYEGALKRLLYVRGRGRRYLNKNVFFTARIRTMHERFPDAKFIYLARHPYEVMPSFLNMFHAAWRTHSPEIAKDSPEVKALAQVGYDYYRYALMCRDLLPEESFRVVRYDDLVASPRATVESVYEWMGLPITESFRAKLDEATSAQRSYERPIEHTLEEWGLTREEIYRELRPVFDAFGFAR